MLLVDVILCQLRENTENLKVWPFLKYQRAEVINNLKVFWGMLEGVSTDKHLGIGIHEVKKPN